MSKQKIEAVQLQMEAVADLLSKVQGYMKKNFPGKKVLHDTKMSSEDQYEIYGFNGMQIMVRENDEYVRYYPLVPSYKMLCNK